MSHRLHGSSILTEVWRPAWPTRSGRTKAGQGRVILATPPGHWTGEGRGLSAGTLQSFPILPHFCPSTVPPLSQHAFHQPSNSHLACSWKTEFKKWVYFATKVFESIRIFSQNVFFHIWFEDPLWSTSFILSSSERFSTWRLPGIATKFERMLLLDSIPRDADWNGPKSGMGSMVFKSSPRQTQCTQRIQNHSSKQ